MRTPEEDTAVTASKLASVMRAISFRGRGFSDRTVQALLDHGIDFPESLLFLEPSRLKQIPANLSDKTRWYYRRLADKSREKWPGPLANELHEIVEVLE